MTASISLMEAYMIETLLSKGMPASTLIDHIQKEEAEALNDYDDAFNYTDLIEANKKPSSTIEQAIESDYRIKFISKFGIKRLLELKFNLQEGENYQRNDAKFFGISLSEEQIQTLETMIAPHWELENKREVESGLLQVDILHVTEV